MWLGIVSVVLLAILIITAIVPDRLRVHNNYPSFKYWHRVLTIAMIASAAYHIVVSNFYLDAWYQAGLFILISLAVCLGRAYWIKLGQIAIAPPTVYLSISTILIVAFAGLRNLPA
jgi:hypothetical protein